MKVIDTSVNISQLLDNGNKYCCASAAIPEGKLGLGIDI